MSDLEPLLRSSRDERVRAVQGAGVVLLPAVIASEARNDEFGQFAGRVSSILSTHSG